jgi:catalase
VAVSSQHVLDVINSAFGHHDGFRALHAKGVVCSGSFTSTAEASRLTRAAHMQASEPVRVTVRFSNGSGNPRHPDAAPDPRGLAVKFYLPDGSRTDLVTVSSPRFVTKTPEGFIGLLEARAAGVRGAAKVPFFLAQYPEAIRTIPVIAPTLAAPESYAVIRYYGIHAFKWLDADGGERFVRYRLLPSAPGRRLAPWTARKRDRDYLQHEIRERFATGPVKFSLEVTIAGSQDPIDDPSAAWPKQRRRVIVGELAVTGLDTERERGDDILVFDPSRVTDGIECSDDPVLRYRPGAYSESVARRSTG